MLLLSFLFQKSGKIIVSEKWKILCLVCIFVFAVFKFSYILQVDIFRKFISRNSRKQDLRDCTTSVYLVILMTFV